MALCPGRSLPFKGSDSLAFPVFPVGCLPPRSLIVPSSDGDVGQFFFRWSGRSQRRQTSTRRHSFIIWPSRRHLPQTMTTSLEVLFQDGEWRRRWWLFVADVCPEHSSGGGVRRFFLCRTSFHGPSTFVASCMASWVWFSICVSVLPIKGINMAATQILFLAFLAMTSSLATASDPDPLQDFCVADNTSAVLVNGFVCKNPAKVIADDFFFSGLRMAGNTANPQGSMVTPANVAQIPGLNTLGTSMARIDYAHGGLNPPHTHPRATEILFVIHGTLYVGFVTSNPNNTLFSKVLNSGDVFVFPEGLIHFQLNIGPSYAIAIVAFSSQNPGVITIANAVFGSKPPISDEVLAKAFQVNKEIIDKLQAPFASQ
ncbi:hypothetical protein J5N97_009030 [Dioscorea zingiberensis]|uniref:Cupin type-1 domain-containing protein n=1 Tax=Dioscorea zingiberensis TaxID=325984 RepID=A0A9D5HL19_9LILI|nr:hypothetical protein J5N97_009030 [Dioscorea zingiberensis]